MTEESRASRTVGDIVHELQREQKQFNFVIRILVALLALTAIVMVTLLTTTIVSFSSTEKHFKDEITRAAAAARVSDAESKYDLSAITSQLDEIREDQEAQRGDVQLLQSLNRTLATHGRADDMSLLDLTARARQAARHHALGKRLNTTTAVLVFSIREIAEAPLSPDERRFLLAMYQDWQKRGSAEEELKALSEIAVATELRGLSFAALAQQHFAARNAIDPGSDDNCVVAIQYAAQAETLGVRALGPLAWAAECMRKQGRSEQSLAMFSRSLAFLNTDDATDENRSLATRGAGTTLISQAAAGRMSEDTWSADVVAAIRNELGDSPNPRISASASPMDAARTLIKYATTVGTSARNQVLGVYTMENVGFTYVIDENWLACFNDANGLDATVSSPWNLIVLHICSSKLLEANTFPSDSMKTETEASRVAAGATLSQFAYDWFNEMELRTLLPEQYKAAITELIANAKARHDTAQQVKASGGL